jgi:hydroxyacyl-ACP dehydratase HTD2-like protein with hotdog domain
MSRHLSSALRQRATVIAPCRHASPILLIPFLTPLPRTTTPRSTHVPGCRRHQSTDSPAATAEEAASTLLSRFAGRTRTTKQVLDANQLQKLSLTLKRRALWPGLDVSADPPPAGTPLPRGYHLVYFTPNGVEGGDEGELGRDGSDLLFNAPGRFTRRMWAGGRMRWLTGDGVADEVGLRVGDEVVERTRLTDAVAKRSRGGAEMVLVKVEKEFWSPRGLALVDER